MRNMQSLDASEFTPETDIHLREIGRHIRAHRRALRISAIATAEAAGISRVTLHRIEKGEPSVNAGAYASAWPGSCMALKPSRLRRPSPCTNGTGLTSR